MVYLLLLAAAGAAVFFYVRLKLLSRALKETNEELGQIAKSLEENRILKKEAPSGELEALLLTINDLLKKIRAERVVFRGREREFQKQIECISHDLRTPLTSMIGYLKIMDREALSREDRENLDVVLHKSQLLQRLISQFYDFSRLTADDYVLKTEKVDMSRLLRELLVDTYQELENKGLLVELEIPEHCVYVTGDANALERIILNLLQNACRYGETAFKVQLKEGDGQATACFVNDVAGLDEKDVRQMFERFYMKDSARAEGASGLGLTVARCLAEKMGGELSAGLRDEKWLELVMRLKKA